MLRLSGIAEAIYFLTYMVSWLVEGPEYMRPKVILQSDIRFLGIQSQFLAISFLGSQTTMIRMK